MMLGVSFFLLPALAVKAYLKILNLLQGMGLSLPLRNIGLQMGSWRLFEDL
jgi:hypothetical protein